MIYLILLKLQDQLLLLVNNSINKTFSLIPLHYVIYL